MKEIKKFILVYFIILIINVLGGIVCRSNTLLSVSILDLLLLIISLFLTKRKENTNILPHFIPRLAINAEIVYPIENPLYAIIIYTKKIFSKKY